MSFSALNLLIVTQGASGELEGLRSELLLRADRHQESGDVAVPASACSGQRRTNLDSKYANRNHAALSEAIVDDLFALNDSRIAGADIEISAPRDEQSHGVQTSCPARQNQRGAFTFRNVVDARAAVEQRVRTTDVWPSCAAACPPSTSEVGAIAPRAIVHLARR